MAEHEVKKRKISSKDWDEVAAFIKKEFQKRKDNTFRKKHERIWKELDRQVYMEPMAKINEDPDLQQHGGAAMELGELSRASEVLSADTRRQIWPQSRQWFEPHSEISADTKIGQQIRQINGEEFDSEKEQKRIDGRIRAVMSQQHLDFGLKARHDLSVKEALHHGGYVAEVKMETMMGVQDGTKVSRTSAPVWVPHSMWDCYPDASTKTQNIFYTGSMIINLPGTTYGDVKKWSGPGYRQAVIKKLNLQDHNKVTAISYFGDISMPRKDGSNINLPNSKVIFVDDKVVYYMPNELKHPQIIYNGYERLNLKDPYFISPLVKSSPNQKIASVMANEMIDGMKSKTKPPIVYDGNDPDLVRNGGVNTEPGSQTASKSLANHKIIDIGDPNTALQGLTYMMAEIQKATGVDAIRSGMTGGAEQTATEVERTRQGGQIRTIDFVEKLELHGLKPFLYMQHALNLKHLENYPFFNPEMDAPDFERASKAELPQFIHFDIVGSKGLKEEEQRQAQTLQVTNALMGWDPSLVNLPEVGKTMYQDAGNKSPESLMNITPKDEQFKQQLQQAQEESQQQVQQLQQEMGQQIQELQKQVSTDELLKEKHAIVVENNKITVNRIELEKEQLDVKIAELEKEKAIEEALEKSGDEIDQRIDDEVQSKLKDELIEAKQRKSKESNDVDK